VKGGYSTIESTGPFSAGLIDYQVSMISVVECSKFGGPHSGRVRFFEQSIQRKLTKTLSAREGTSAPFQCSDRVDFIYRAAIVILARATAR